MAAIKGKGKGKLILKESTKDKLKMAQKGMSSKAKNILRRPQDNQPIPTVAV